MADSNPDFLSDLNIILSILYFSITFFTELYIFIRLSFKLDLAAIVISISYLLAMIFRTPMLSSEDINIAVYPAIAQKLTWGSLYYFTFEMKRLEDKLKSETFEESRKRASATRL